jgi:hypothetical protein
MPHCPHLSMTGAERNNNTKQMCAIILLSPSVFAKFVVFQSCYFSA